MDPGEVHFDLGDRMQKSREWCGIKSTARMAELINERRPQAKPVAASTISAWERGTNQPTRHIRVDELVLLWVAICNESGAQFTPPRSTSVEFLYGLKTGSFSSLLFGLDAVAGQGTFLDDAGQVVDFWMRPELALV